MPTPTEDRLEGRALERAVDACLSVIGDVGHKWVNAERESYLPYDFLVWSRREGTPHRLDAKGSVKYPNSFVTVGQLDNREEAPYDLAFVTSDFTVVTVAEIIEDINGPQRFTEYRDYYDRKRGLWLHGLTFQGTLDLGTWARRLQ